MKKDTYNKKLKAAGMHFAAKQYEKALKEYIELNNSDKPLGKKLDLPGQIEKCQSAIKDTEFLSIRGVGVIVLSALNKRNQFQEIYRLPIERKVNDKGEDIHPLRLPVILKTDFIKATNQDMIDEEVKKYQASLEIDPDLNEKIADLEKESEKLNEMNEDLGKEIEELKAKNEELSTTVGELTEELEKKLAKDPKKLSKEDLSKVVRKGEKKDPKEDEEEV